MYPTFADLEKSHENPWGGVIAPYLAQHIYTASKEAYADERMIPKTVTVYETNMVTVLLRQANGEHVRVYLWVGTRDEAKKANCLMDLEEPIGKFVFVKTTIPHDIELYTKFEIIEESTDGMFEDDQVSAIVASSPMDVKKASDEVYAAVIQKGVERFAIELMSSDMTIVAVYLTNRKQRRGLPTLFEEKDVLIGTVEAIRALGEEEDSGSEDSDDEDSDYQAPTTSDHAEAAEFLLRQMESGDDDSESESSGSEESSYNETDAKVDELVEIHNDIVELVESKGGLEKNRKKVEALWMRMLALGTIEYSDSEDSDSEDPPFDLMDLGLEGDDGSASSAEVPAAAARASRQPPRKAKETRAAPAGAGAGAGAANDEDGLVEVD